jgi:hypothetical protein
MSRRRPLDWAWVMGLLMTGMGLFLGALGLYVSWGAEHVDWFVLAFTSVGGLFLTALGALTLVKSIRNNRRTLARNRMRKMFPDQPWRWRPAWATGKIAPEQPGTTVLELDTVPAPVGGPMRGGIVIPFEDSPIGDVVMTLTATRVHVTGTGRRRSLNRDVLWEASYSQPLEGVPAGLRAAVAFDVPADAPPTNDDHPNDEIVWQLKAASERAGKAYSATFVVPVF